VHHFKEATVQRLDLQRWVVDAVTELGGSAGPVAVARYIWQHHESDLRAGGDLFFTWQYDIRWEAQKLRDCGVFKKKHGVRSGTWDLA
jgi:hypothetical protein